MITTVIFDMDGLLFSTEPLYFECYKKAASSRGLLFTYELFESCVGMTGEASDELIRSYLGQSTDVEGLRLDTYLHFEEYLREGGIVEFRPGAKEAVEYFYNRGLKIGLASSNISKWVEYLLTRYGIRKYFSSVLTADMVSKPKPDPELYLRTAQILNSDTSECLVFEDSIAGATAAIAAHMRTCVVPQIKQPNSYVRSRAFKVYQSLEDIYPDMDELLS